MTGVIQLGQAYTIVRLNQHQLAGRTPFLEAKTQLQKELHDKKKNELRAALDAKLRQSATVQEM